MVLSFEGPSPLPCPRVAAGPPVEVVGAYDSHAQHNEAEDTSFYAYMIEVAVDPETGEVRGMFTLITRAANPLMRQIHNSGDNAFRMPLFLPKEMELEWLRPDLTDTDIALTPAVVAAKIRALGALKPQ